MDFDSKINYLGLVQLFFINNMIFPNQKNSYVVHEIPVTTPYFVRHK